MNPIGKALWFIETHFTSDIILDDLAKLAGVSRYHMSRAFSMVVGLTIPEYVRGRRLTEAARTLAAGAPDILAVALEVGYGSHEAFTRAFRDQFGVTPEAVRTQASVDKLKLLEAIKMDDALLDNLQTPRVVEGKAMLIAGLSERYDNTASARIPAQWQRFAPYLGNIPGQVGSVAYGVLCNPDEAGTYEYISGVEVSNFAGLPKEFATLRLVEQTYLVFAHQGHVSEIRRTWMTIFKNGVAGTGYQMLDAPQFERYGEDFDPRTGTGGIEIWIPARK